MIFSLKGFVPLMRNCLFRNVRAKHLRATFCTQIEPQEERLQEDVEYELKNPQYQEMANEFIGVVAQGHRTLVIQPKTFIKGFYESKKTTPDLQLAEACALVESLPYWSVVATTSFTLGSLRAKTMFGAPQIKMIKRKIEEVGLVTAIFVSIDQMKHTQKIELEKEFGVQIFDRYSIVIHIFRCHARTAVAKLQVGLAELPYIYRQMSVIDGRINYLEKRRLYLHARQAKLKRALDALKNRRDLVRKQRLNTGIPSVAIVGYTNCGKTTLIKALTGDENMKPRNQLFATLDTTVHQGLLPCQMKINYIDTIGFIQDIPDTLIEPFVVTLEDALLADVIVHLYDASHPDVEAQVAHVRKTIEQLTGGKRSVLEVANKCDLIEENSLPSDILGISASESRGITVVADRIQEMLLFSKDRFFKRIKVGAGSPELAWLYKETTVLSATADPKDNEFTFMDVIMTKNQMEKFKGFIKQNSLRQQN